jgi:hypothetical protein
MGKKKREFSNASDRRASAGIKLNTCKSERTTGHQTSSMLKTPEPTLASGSSGVVKELASVERMHEESSTALKCGAFLKMRELGSVST